MIGFRDRHPDAADAIFAEARALMDDGLDLAFVLDLFPEDAEWLRGRLATSAAIAEAYASEPASYFFEASLKAKFLAAAEHPRTPATVTTPATGHRVRTAITSLSLAGAATAAGVVTLGFVTAGNAVPGDWNYGFKLTGERLQYALSRGDERVNIQIAQAETRVYEIQVLSQQGDVSTSDISRLKKDVQAVATLAQAKPLDDVQKARLQGVAQTSQMVLQDTRTKQPALEEPVSAAGAAIHAAVLMALGTATPTATATATVTTTPVETATTTVTPTPPAATETPTPPPTEQPTETTTATVAPTDTPTPEPTETETATPEPTQTETPTASGTPVESPTATETASPEPTAPGEGQTTGTPTGTPPGTTTAAPPAAPAP